jgi:hypothetical protein
MMAWFKPIVQAIISHQVIAPYSAIFSDIVDSEPPVRTH